MWTLGIRDKAATWDWKVRYEGWVINLTIGISRSWGGGRTLAVKNGRWASLTRSQRWKQKYAHKMMEGGLVRPSEAFKTRSSRSSNLASVRRDGTSISIGRFCSNAHFKLATLSGVDFTSMVESETGTVVAERYEGGDVGTGSTRLNGTTTDTIGVLLVDCNLRNTNNFKHYPRRSIRDI